MVRKKATKSEQRRLTAIHDMPCIACELWGPRFLKLTGRLYTQALPTEGHHIVDKGYREHSGGHDATLPLCSWHHRGICRDNWTSSQMTNCYGPSFELDKRTFVAEFGTERALLVIVDGRLK